jgi:hypothetical protein
LAYGHRSTPNRIETNGGGGGGGGGGQRGAGRRRGREKGKRRLTLTQSVSLRHLTSSMANPLHDFDIFLLLSLGGLREGKEARRLRVSGQTYSPLSAAPHRRQCNTSHMGRSPARSFFLSYFFVFFSFLFSILFISFRFYFLYLLLFFPFMCFSKMLLRFKIV